MYTKKSKGFKTVPYGTPDATGFVDEWEQQWQMQFNPEKCEVLTITKKRKPLHHDYTIHGHILQHVDSTKYLGLNISARSLWNSRCNRIC
jgi:hypothetical protein